MNVNVLIETILKDMFFQLPNKPINMFKRPKITVKKQMR